MFLKRLTGAVLHALTHPRSWNRKTRCFVAIALLLTVYVGSYKLLGTHQMIMWHECAIAYPGAVRFYAFTDRGAVSLGQHDFENQESMGRASVHFFDDSVYLARPVWYSSLWRLYAPLERLEHRFYGLRALSVQYPPDSRKYEFVNLDYLHGQIIAYYCDRAVQSDKRSRSRTMSNRIVEHRWSLDGMIPGTVASATQSRWLETTDDRDEQEHLALDSGGVFTRSTDWSNRIRSYGPSTSGADFTLTGESHPTARLSNAYYAPPQVDSRRREVLAVIDHVPRILDASTHKVIAAIPQSAAWQAFQATVPRETNPRNSKHFLLSDPRIVVRQPGIDAIGETDSATAIAVIYDIGTDRTRRTELHHAQRADIIHVESIKGELWFVLLCYNAKQWGYLVTTETGTTRYFMPIESFSGHVRFDLQRELIVWIGGSNCTIASESDIFRVQLLRYRTGEISECCIRVPQLGELPPHPPSP